LVNIKINILRCTVNKISKVVRQATIHTPTTELQLDRKLYKHVVILLNVLVLLPFSGRYFTKENTVMARGVINVLRKS